MTAVFNVTVHVCNILVRATSHLYYYESDTEKDRGKYNSNSEIGYYKKC